MAITRNANRRFLERVPSAATGGGSELLAFLQGANELARQRETLEGEARDVMSERGVEVDYEFGKMIEVPKAELTADENRGAWTPSRRDRPDQL